MKKHYKNKNQFKNEKYYKNNRGYIKKKTYKDMIETKWMWRAVAFGIPFVVSILICAAKEIYPFGNNCILHVDMYHQYCPFFMEFHIICKYYTILYFP